jgi:hypothetical protein
MTEFNFDKLLDKLKTHDHRVIVFAPQSYFNQTRQFCIDNNIEYLAIDRHVNKEGTSIRLKDHPNHWLLIEMVSYADTNQSTLITSFGDDFTDMIYVYLECDNPIPQVCGRVLRTRSHREKCQLKCLNAVYMIGLNVRPTKVDS